MGWERVPKLYRGEFVQSHLGSSGKGKVEKDKKSSKLPVAGVGGFLYRRSADRTQSSNTKTGNKRGSG